MRCTGWVYYAAPTCDSAPPPVSRGGAPSVRSVAGALGLSAALGLEVRDGLLDLGLVLRLAGLLDHLGGDGGRCELLEHACHVWPPRGRLRIKCPNERGANHAPGGVVDLAGVARPRPW